MNPITCSAKCGMKIFINSRTSTATPLAFGNGQVISSPLYNAFDYLSMLGYKLIHFCERASWTNWTTFCRRNIHGTLQWRHNEHDEVSNDQHHQCLLNGYFSRRSKKTSEPRVTGLCAVNSPVTGEFPAQMASNAENVSIWWRHHVSSGPGAEQGTNC